MTYDAIVLGLGGMGSATIYNLAKRGLKVLGIEQFDIGHGYGSSHGVNRIIRLAYFEDSRYVPLLKRSYELWREIERASGIKLLFITGCVDAGPADGEIVCGSIRSCQEHNLPYAQMDAGQLHRRFPGYRFPRELAGVFQQDGGFVLCEEAIHSYIGVAQSLGAEVHACEEVKSWEVSGNEVRVHTSTRTYSASRLVICAGPWASKFIPSLKDQGLALPERQVLIWTQPRRHAEYFELGRFPVFNMEAVEDGQTSRYYGFPIYGVPGFKIGKYHHLNEAADPDRMNRECGPQDEAVLRRAIQKYFPDADGPTLAMVTCLFTNSWDENFVLDLHPEHPQVAVAAGFSGHGFKFASVVGEIMADLVQHGGTTHDLGLFSAKRMQGSRQAST